MIRRPPRSTRTYTLFPYTTLFRSSYFGIKIHNLALIYLGYGVLGGIGLGIGYISPVSTLIKWFPRSEEHTSELQSLMRISYAVFCLKKKNNTYTRSFD